MKTKIINYLKKHPQLRLIARFGLLQYRKIKYLLSGVGLKVDSNLIVFECYMGRKYTCNPKALYLELLNNKKYSNYKFVWVFKEPKNFKFLKNKRTKIIKYGSKEYKQIYHQAKYFITNSRLPEWIIKKNSQIYIQTWHGTPLKKLGFDIEVDGNNAMNSKREIQNKYLQDSSRYDYMLSPSSFCTEKFKSAFKLTNKTKIIEKGYPRNDQLFKYTKEEIKEVKNKLNIPNNKKVILYAPTWRDNEHISGLGYTQHIELNFDVLKEKLSKEFVILFRSHYFIANKFDFSKYKNFIYNVSDYDEINDLYIISDLLITDYSSVFFDYANLKRPMIFYMYDYDNYKNKLRDFYIDLDELPGPIIKEKNELKLCDTILNIEKNANKYSVKYNKFNFKFNYLDNKNCSREVLKWTVEKNEKKDRILIHNIYFKIKRKKENIILKSISFTEVMNKQNNREINFSKIKLFINKKEFLIKFYLKKGIPWFNNKYLNVYKLILPISIIKNFDIQNKLKLEYENKITGTIKYNYFDHDSGDERNSKIFVNNNTSIYFRQSIKNNVYLTIRKTNEYDLKKGKIKILFAYCLSKLYFWKNITLFFEKEVSRYEESASCVFEKFVDQEYKNCYYILNKNNPKIKDLKEKYRKKILYADTLKHLIYFFAARNFISSEIIGHSVKVRIANRLVRKKNCSKNINYVFLQHGVMYMVSLNSNLRVSFRRPNFKTYKVVVSSLKEAAHFIKYSNYHLNDFYITGIAKFDKSKKNKHADKIVIMPTWRRWEYNLALNNIEKTKYYKMIDRIVNAIPDELQDKIIVLPHPLMLEALTNSDSHLKKLLIDKTYDDVLKECKLLITDYSSISYDAFYRGSNVIFYWEEKEECLKYYGKNSKIMLDEESAFGDICYNVHDLKKCLHNNYFGEQQSKFKKRYNEIVTYHDNKNTERIVELIKKDMKIS